mgnify:CR=1 FL=1
MKLKMNKGFFIPKRIADKLVDVVNKATREHRLNLGLFLDKYVLWWYDDREDKWDCNLEVQVPLLRKIYKNPQNVKNLLTDPNVRGRRLRGKVIENERLSVPFEILPLDYHEFYKNRIEYLLDVLKQMGFHVEYIPNKQSGLSLNWRLIINLGAASVYETSLLLHRNYSVPYIPGSAVKGVTRHWAILKFAKNSGIDPKDIDDALSQGKDVGIEVNGLSFRDLINIFGSQGEKGEVIFFDALPIFDKNKDSIILDVMNIHYKPYYEASERDLKEKKEKAPGDWHRPVPIFFLAVEKGTKFRFALASKDGNLVKKAKNLLVEALRKVGIGAKTSVGYGYFKV